MRYALVNKQTKLVENIVEWDNDTGIWQPPATHEAILTADKVTIDWLWDMEARKFEQVETLGNVRMGETWDGTKFVEVEQPPIPLPSNEEQSDARRAAYEKEADPIFFLFQRGEATQEEWTAKIAEIKERFPYYFDEQGNLIEAQ